jgi:chromosome segregation ATPase
MPGNILEIELYNFMTFDYLKCKPGPRLNLVIGPNGSGKSSLVCAIALGLCGEPQVGLCFHIVEQASFFFRQEASQEFVFVTISYDNFVFCSCLGEPRVSGHM